MQPDKKEKQANSPNTYLYHVSSPCSFRPMLTSPSLGFILSYLLCSSVTSFTPQFDRCLVFLIRHGSPITSIPSLYCNIRSAYGYGNSNDFLVWLRPPDSRRATRPTHSAPEQTSPDHCGLLSATGTYAPKCT